MVVSKLACNVQFSAAYEVVGLIKFLGGMYEQQIAKGFYFD